MCSTSLSLGWAEPLELTSTMIIVAARGSCNLPALILLLPSEAVEETPSPQDLPGEVVNDMICGNQDRDPGVFTKFNGQQAPAESASLIDS